MIELLAVKIFLLSSLSSVAYGVCSDAVYDNCCVRGRMFFDMARNTSVAPNPIPGVEVLQDTDNYGNRTAICSDRLLLKITFDPQPRDGRDGSWCSACQATPGCGRTMLRVGVTIDGWIWGRQPPQPANWIFHVSESRELAANANSNQEGTRLPEVVGKEGGAYYVPGSPCANDHVALPTLRMKNDVYLYLSNQHLRLDTFSTCSDCLFDLSGQRQNASRVLYVGINRSVHDPSASGGGACLVALTWMCPWCLHAP